VEQSSGAAATPTELSEMRTGQAAKLSAGKEQVSETKAKRRKHETAKWTNDTESYRRMTNDA